MAAVISFVMDASGHRSAEFSLIKRVPVVRSATSAAFTARDGGAAPPVRENTEFETGPAGATKTVLASDATERPADDPPFTAPAVAALPSGFTDESERSGRSIPLDVPEFRRGGSVFPPTRWSETVIKESAGRTNRGTIPTEDVAGLSELPVVSEYGRGYTAREMSAMATITPANAIFPE
jgi:hypothetical protein